MKPMESKSEMENPQPPESDGSDSPFAPVLEKLDEYIDKPELATTETLTALKQEIMDAAEIDEVDPNAEGSPDEGAPDEKKPFSVMVAIGRKAKGMGAYIIALALLGAMCGNAHAVKRTIVNTQAFPPVPGVYMTDAVYRSSVTCSAEFNMKISSNRPTELSHITVTKAGSAGSSFAVWDAALSSGPGAILIGSSRPASATGDWWFKTGTSSGLVVNVEANGGIKPCLDIWHYEY